MTCDYSLIEPGPGLCAGPNERAIKIQAQQILLGECPFTMPYKVNGTCVRCVENSHCSRLKLCFKNSCVPAEFIPEFGQRCENDTECERLRCIEGKCAYCADGSVLGSYICYAGNWVHALEYSLFNEAWIGRLIASTLVLLCGGQIIFFLACAYTVWSCYAEARSTCRVERSDAAIKEPDQAAYE